MLKKKILLIITGSVSSYKALYLIRLLKQEGVSLNCVMTQSAKHFITPLAVSSLTGRKVYEDLFDLDDEAEMGHINLAKSHDLIIIAPATANFISKSSKGIADDLASSILLATDKPVFFYPAMNINMWNNLIIKDNIRYLKTAGYRVMTPEKGSLACGDEGYGRLTEPIKILSDIKKFFINKDTLPLKGISALVTAGPTVEPIDPVRYISNRSSGIQGYSFAEELTLLGAKVSLITGPTKLEKPRNLAKFIPVETAQEMYNACKRNLPRDLFVSVAAVADWRIKNAYEKKIKKSVLPPTLNLIKNPDILKYVSTHENRPKLVIGFAAETNCLDKNAILKIKNKKCDFLIANSLSDKNPVVGSNINSVSVYNEKGLITKYKKINKKLLSNKILTEVIYPRLCK